MCDDRIKMTLKSLCDKIFMTGKKTNQEFAVEDLNGFHLVKNRKRQLHNKVYNDLRKIKLIT